MPDTRHNAMPNSANGSPDNNNLEEGMWQLNIGENSQEGGDDRGNRLPDRSTGPDCIFYMRTGMCGFGSKCKYNHPTFSGQEIVYSDELPQRDGQPDCQFYLKTGTCKFGSSCKYNHPRDKHDGGLIQLNILGLPIRKDEKSCPYYMRTSSCKFGIACKFNHPQPSTFGAIVPASGASIYGYAGSLAPAAGAPVIGGHSQFFLSRSASPLQGPPAYMPVVLQPNAMQHGWTTQLGTVGIPTTDAATSKHNEQTGSSSPVLLPERPDRPECQFYLKTGSCKYGTSCKYNHPKDRNQQVACAIGPLGLPLRPGHPICGSYTSYGNCKYGAVCKFDHPILGYYNYALPAFAVPDPSVLLTNQSGSHTPTFSENSSKTAKASNEPVKSKKSAAMQDKDDREQNDPSTETSPSHTTPQSESPPQQSD